MSYNPQNPNGNNTAANSTPVTLASDTNGPVKIYDGTNTANVIAGDSGFNGLVTAGATKTYTFSTSASGAQTIVANTPCEGYSWIEIVFTSVGSGLALTGQFSTTSGGTYVNCSSFSNRTSPNAAAPLGTSVNTIYGSPVNGNFFQIAVSALTSGTFAGTVTLRAITPVPEAMYVTFSPSGTVGSATPSTAVITGVTDGTNLRALVQPSVSNNTTGTGIASTAPMVQYNSTAPTITSGDYYVAQADVNGNTKIYLATKLDATNDNITAWPYGHSYNHISSATTTVVKSSSGVLHSLLINTPVASATITIYDNTAGSGTVIGVITCGGTLANDQANLYTYDVAFTTGLTIVTSAATDITVSYR
jgi:hypothetical protein